MLKSLPHLGAAIFALNWVCLKMATPTGEKFRCQLIQTVIHPSSSLGAHQKRPVNTDIQGFAHYSFEG